MKKIGKNEIREALEHFTFDKKEYHGYELDNFILSYHGFDVSKVLLEEPTELSNEFDYITDVYCLIDEIMEQKGYKSDDLELYVKE